MSKKSYGYAGHNFSAYLLASACSIAFIAQPAFSQTTQNEEGQDTIIVIGARQAYQGDFTPLETPQSELAIDQKR